MQTVPNKTVTGQNANDISPRRSSATAISNRPPLPTNNRSQSLDEHLDDDESLLENGAVQDTEGASDFNQSGALNTDNATVNQSPTTKIIITEEQNHPKSKSMDDLLTENVEEENANIEDRSQSLDILSEHSDIVNEENRLNRSDTNSIGSTSSLNQAISTSPNPRLKKINPTNQDDAKSCSTFYSQTDSTGSQNSETRKRSLLNKYVNKMKSLIKK